MTLWKTSLFAVLAVAACATVSTQARLMPGTNLAQYRTFAWAPRARQIETPADQAIRGSIQQDLAEKGIVPNPGQPDFLVSYHTKTRERMEVYPGYYGAGYYAAWGYPDINTYTEGTLIVDFIDPRTQQIFWRGTATGVVEHPDNPDPEKIADAVDKLMDEYPAQVAGVARPQM